MKANPISHLFGRLIALAGCAPFAGGCASLDAGPELDRYAAAVEHAVDVAPLPMDDPVAVESATRELLAGGLDPEEAVRVALLNNARIRAAMTSIGVARADFVQSTLFTNPTLFLSLRFPDGGGTGNFEASFAQNIAELWLVPARKAAARRDLDRVVLEAARETAGIVLDVRTAYVQSVRAEQAIDLAKDGVPIANRLVEFADLRRQAGSGSDIDLTIARAQSLQAEADLRNARRNAVEAKAALLALLGLEDAPDTLLLTGATGDGFDRRISADDLIATARASRLDFQIMEQSIASAEAQRRLERVRFLRSIELGFEMELEERRRRGDRDWLAEAFYDSLQSAAPTPPNIAPRESRGRDTLIGPSLSMELPLWDQNQAQIAKADRQLERLQQIRRAMEVEAAQDIHAGLARARTAAENMRLFREQLLPTAERSLELAQEGYRIGQVAFLSLVEANRAYLATRVQQLQASEDAALAAIDIERVTGRPMAALAPKKPDATTSSTLSTTDPRVGEVSP